MNSFIEEFHKLKIKFPTQPAIAFGNDNCEYGDNLFRSQNCYYVFSSAEMEGCLFTSDGFKEISDVECDFGISSEGNCECIDFADCNGCYHAQSCARCYNMWYSWYCDDCHDCFGCSNLANKEYCIFNIQYTKEEYEKKLPGLKVMSKTEALKRLNETIKKFPQANAEQVDCTNSDYCDYSYFNNNCYYCFDTANNEDCGYLNTSYECKSVWNGTYVVRGEQSAECSDSSDLYGCFRVNDSDRCHSSYFLEECTDCHDCFGCVKLSYKSYCILNVQYTKEEYDKRVAELKKELGLYFKEPTAA